VPPENGKVIPELGKLQNSESPNPSMFIELENIAGKATNAVSKTEPCKTIDSAFQFIADLRLK